MYKKIKNAKDKIETKGDDSMIKQIAWNTFKNTGNINTFLELIEVQNLENSMNNIDGEKNGNNKNEWNHITGE